MTHGTESFGRLSKGEQRALSSFLAGRLPAGQLDTALATARAEAIALAQARTSPPPPVEAPVAAPALRAA